MLFNSFEYALFFIATLFIYFKIPLLRRWPVLLVASYIFYMGWQPLFVFLLFFSTVVDYIGGLVMARAEKEWVRRAAMTTAVSINLLLLGVFKYYNFFAHTVTDVGHGSGYDFHFIYLNVILPVGISFYTFQSLSYSFDVYARKIPAQLNFFRYALYVAFFPQLEAGPIERAARLIPQLQDDKVADVNRFRSGLWLIGWGLFKKMCISDLISPFVNGVYNNSHSYSGSYLLIASVLFAIQIYCDFSGYSDIAIGCARMLGFDLMINFQQPYYSRSLTEFWRRWHISLSTWFRDYVYFPLGGSQGSMVRTLCNIMVVFILSGIWHGAAWTFIIWGGLHGLVLCLERVSVRGLRTAHLPGVDRITGALALVSNGMRLAWTNLIVLVGWIFFRARTLGDATYILSQLPHLGRVDYGTFKILGFASFEIVLAALHIMVLFSVDYMIRFRRDTLERIGNIRLVAFTGAILLFYDIALFGIFEHRDFIYFQF